MKKTIYIDGMMCGHCRAHVEKALSELAGVSSVDVSLEEKRAAVTMSKPVDDDILAAAVKKAGYTPTKIEA